jgi:uncharacterized membrane protein
MRSGKIEGDMVGIKQFVFRWAATTIAVMVASSVIRGIRYDTVPALIGASLLPRYSQRFCAAISADP